MLDLERREWRETVAVLAIATVVTMVLFTAVWSAAVDARADAAAERAELLAGKCGPRIVQIEIALGERRGLSNDEARSMCIQWIADGWRSEGDVEEARVPVEQTD